MVAFCICVFLLFLWSYQDPLLPAVDYYSRISTTATLQYFEPSNNFQSLLCNICQFLSCAVLETIRADSFAYFLARYRLLVIIFLNSLTDVCRFEFYYTTTTFSYLVFVCSVRKKIHLFPLLYSCPGLRAVLGSWLCAAFFTADTLVGSHHLFWLNCSPLR